MSSNNASNGLATDKDLLGFGPYVKAIAEFLTDEGKLPPITLSIEGQWGSGKSSFMKQLKKEIEGKNKKSEGVGLDENLIVGSHPTLNRLSYNY